MNLKRVKTGVFGIQGSGKTWIVEHELIKSFKRPFVYLLHPEDFTSCGKNVTIYIPKKLVDGKQLIDTSAEHLNKIMGLFIEEAKKGKYDAFILDEASTFLPKDYRTLQSYPHLLDAVDNHRHYGKKKGDGFAFVYMARRPQSITTEITETSEYLFIFALDGKNVKEYFGKIDEHIPEMMKSLSKDKHNFIVKELGQKPKLFSKIKLNNGGKSNEQRRRTKNV